MGDLGRPGPGAFGRPFDTKWPREECSRSGFEELVDSLGDPFSISTVKRLTEGDQSERPQIEVSGFLARPCTS